MEITLFLETLRKRWYIPMLFLVIALAGMYVYHRDTDMKTAQATVAVLDPLVAKPGAYQEAQVTFDSVVKSNRLAQRVAAVLHLPPAVVSRRISATVIATLSSYNASPLYGVKGSGKTEAQAIAMTNAATVEARALYIELNTADSSSVRQSLQPELDRIQADLQKAQDDYDHFVALNKTADLPSQVDRQMTIVSNLKQNLVQARVGELASGISRGRTSQALTRELANQQAQLDALTARESQFRTLAFNLQLAQDRLAQFSQVEQAAVLGERLPAQLDVKILDTASVQSPFFWLFLTYSTAILLGLLLGLSCIYVLALYRKSPQTADQIARIFGSPVLVRVPRGTT